MSFARYKGEAENALLAAGFSQVYLFRPAYIYPVEPRREPNFGYRLLRAIYPAFRVLFPNQVIRADDLARAMVDVALRGTGERRTLVFENGDIQAIVEVASSPTRGNPAEGGEGQQKSCVRYQRGRLLVTRPPRSNVDLDFS